MSTEIQVLSESDLQAISAIEQRAHITPWSDSLILSNFGHRYHNFGLFEGKKLLGYCINSQVVDEATLLNLAVAPQQQRRQLGRRLLRHLIQQCEQAGMVQIWLEVRVSNHAAIGLYESEGFCSVDVRANYYPASDGGREDACVMCLQLGW